MEDKTSSSFKVVAARIEKEVSIVVTTKFRFISEIIGIELSGTVGPR